jgi:hypothetical protein
LVLALSSALPGRTALAEPPLRDPVAAEALFESGRKLVDAGHFAEACPKFADSQKLDPSPATLLNLANCTEKIGRTATAWATYREAASAAAAAGRQDYVASADRHADALVPRLSHLVISVSRAVAGLVLQRDGAPVEQAEWGVSMPIDSGPHVLLASAPGYQPWTTRVDIARDGLEVTVSVPQLEAVARPDVRPPSAALTAEPGSVPSIAAIVSPASNQSPKGSTQRVVGVVVGGLGLVGVGVAAGFAVFAKNKYNQSLGDCLSANVCGSEGLSLRSDARTAGDIATWTLALGAVALAGGVSLWIVSPRVEAPKPSSRVSLALAPTAGGAALRGTW